MCYDLYESDNGWGAGLGAKEQNDADVCALAEILKDDDDDDDNDDDDDDKTDEKSEEEKKNDDETNKTADELLKK